MNEGLISKRYAKALYEYAEKLGEEQSLYERMKALNEVWKTVPELHRTLSNPMVADKEKQSLMNEATGKNPEQSYLDFVRLITTNHREPHIRNIALSYQYFYRKKKNISVVRITSAKEMTEEALERIRKQVVNRTHGEVEFTNIIDSSIGGGFIFQLDDTRLDASVKGQLERIRKQLTTS